MMAQVRLINGETVWRTIYGIENDGSGDYGYIRYQGRKIPVSQSTTIRHADGRVQKAWDEIIQVAYSMPVEEEW